MPKVSLVKFAELCGMPHKNLYTYIQRGKVYVHGEGKNQYIETEHDLNIAFYKNRFAKGKIKLQSGIPSDQLLEDHEKPKRKKEQKQPYRKRIQQADEAALARKRESQEDETLDILDDEDDSKILEHVKGGKMLSLVQAEKLYQNSRAMRNKLAAELAEIELAKRRNELISVDVITPFFQQHNLSIAKETQAMLESELRHMAKRFNLTHDEHVEIRGRFTVEINRMMDRAKEGTRRAIENMIENMDK